MSFGFSAGRARILPSGTSSYGVTYAPAELGVVQNATLDMKVDLKELRGPYRYPVAVADGKGTASGKITFAEMWPETLSAILNNGIKPNSTSVPLAAVNEMHVIPASTYTVTLTNNTVAVADSEVVVVIVAGVPYFYHKVDTGRESTAMATDPIHGGYSLPGNGMIVFASGDAGNTMYCTYFYTTGDSSNVSVDIGQVGLNTALTFQLTMLGIGKNIYTNASQQFIIQMNQCLAPSLKFDLKLDDFTMMDLDFSCFTDVNGNLGSFYLIAPDAAVV